MNLVRFRMKRVVLVGLMLVLSIVALGEKKKVVLMQTSDMHGRIYPHDYATDSNDADAGLAKVQTLVKQVRAEYPEAILIDNGDTVQDNSAELFNDMPIHPMVQAMNFMKYDVWVLGNHEFNFEMDFLKRNIEGFQGDVIAANIHKTSDNSRFVKGYAILEREGIRVAIVGMIPPHVPKWEASAPSHFAGLKFNNLMDETEKVVNELEGKYDVLVGAYHIGRRGEYGGYGIYDIANKFPQFDVIFGGHEHAKYVEEVNGVKIIEPGKYGAALATTEIVVEDGKVLSVVAKNMESKPVDTDTEVTEEFKFVHDQSVEDANKVVGKITDKFIQEPDFITGADKVSTMPTAQLIDTSIIDLINEVQMFYAKSDVSSAALFNFGSNLNKGDFKKKDVAFIYKYPNTLVGVNITGENLKKYMEWSASYYNSYNYGDLTVSFNPEVRGYNYDMFSGMTYDINISKASGERVENIKVNGKPIDMNKTYKLAVNNYRFGTLLGLKLVTPEDKYYDSYEAIQDAGRIRSLIVQYVQEEKNGVISPSVDNNWELTGGNITHPLSEKVMTMVRNGEIKIPRSSDGRTMNVTSLNVANLVKDGKISLADIPNATVYTVQSGDMLSKIAVKYGTTYPALAQLNGLVNPSDIKVGQKIYIVE